MLCKLGFTVIDKKDEVRDLPKTRLPNGFLVYFTSINLLKISVSKSFHKPDNDIGIRQHRYEGSSPSTFCL